MQIGSAQSNGQIKLAVGRLLLPRAPGAQAYVSRRDLVPAMVACQVMTFDYED